MNNEKQIKKQVRKMFNDNELLDLEVGKIIISFRVGIKKALHVPEGLHSYLYFNGFDEVIHLAIKKEVIEKILLSKNK